MDKFTTYTALAAPLDVANVDTDQIVPKQFLKRVERRGFGQVLFYHWRFLEDGSPNPEFVLNQPRYQGAGVLIAGENFGSGSSREHAPWALADYGFKTIIAPSFADIFAGNCVSSGLLTVTLDPATVGRWMRRAQDQEGYAITVDLAAQTLTGSDGFSCAFDIEPFRKQQLLEGLDAIGLTLEHAAAIAAYEEAHRQPWQAAVAGPGGQEK